MSDLDTRIQIRIADVCSRCGTDDRYFGRFEDCFTCRFWDDEFATPGGLIIDGNHFRIGEEPPGEKWAVDPKMYGSYGDGYLIRRLADGAEFVTHNLWHQGLIPARLSRPDTAVFVDDRPVPPPAARHWHADHLRYVGRYEFDAFPFMCMFDGCHYYFRNAEEAAARDDRVAAILGVTR